MKAKLFPAQVELADANRFVAQLHRHHKPVHRCRFSVGVQDATGQLRGVAMAGRPVARGVNPRKVLEAVRICADGTPNACSFLLGKVAHLAGEMGYCKAQTYILDSEAGTSLKAAGWRPVAVVKGRQWFHTDGRPRRTDQPTGDKTRWEVVVCRKPSCCNLEEADR